MTSRTTFVLLVTMYGEAAWAYEEVSVEIRQERRPRPNAFGNTTGLRSGA